MWLKHPERLSKLSLSLAALGKNSSCQPLWISFPALSDLTRSLPSITALWGAPIWAMTRFILLESWLWLTTSLSSQRQVQAGAVPRAPERLLPTASQKDRPLPARAVLQAQHHGEGVWQHQGKACPSSPSARSAMVLPAPSCMPAMGKMFLALNPGSGLGTELGAPRQESLWTRVGKSTICHWLVQ